ncbi:MAG TPA: hypothetical protein VLY63_32355, partial [Anaerolineae bacterium]|nr:hypothetical protein [Anaerolineae bacterium]
LETDDLAHQLKNAQSLVIISPGKDWGPDEIQQVQRFVDKGGRLLLVTDPTRFVVIYDEWDTFVGLDHDAPHINDLATRFGLIFQSDYLYNTVDNEGNFRNIKLTNFADNALTQQLDQLVFYAAHSIVSEDEALLVAGGETRSSASERTEDLTVGLLAADGAVLALGDLTFMTEPYNTVYDNDQLVANIADFLSGAERQYQLGDFPFFFGEQVDLVYTGGPLLDSSLLKGGSTLQAMFADHGKTLTVRAAEDGARDTIFFGLYEQAKDVEPYLEAAQVTLVFTPTETLEVEAKPAPATSPSLTQSLTTTPSITPSLQITPTAEPEQEAPAEAEPEPSDKNRIVIEPLGEMTVSGTSLLLNQKDGAREIMVVLANTEKGLANAMDRLTNGNLEDCLLHETDTAQPSLLALCPAEAAAQGDESGGWEEAPREESPASPLPSSAPEPKPEEPPSQPQGQLLIISMDKGQGRYDSMTSASDYAAILDGRFQITMRSMTEEGLPELKDVLDYDLVIFTMGDFDLASGSEYSDLLFGLVWEGLPILLSGAYISDPETEAVQRDLQVADSKNPLAEGFDPDQVIAFVTPPSGSEYEVGILEEDQDPVAFVRGPDSEESGGSSVVTLQDELDAFRMVIIGFPIYLLPETPKSQLVLNAVAWLLSP